MDLLIKNIELPLEERIQLSIYPNGLVVNHSTLKIEKNRTTAIELPPHDDLISRRDAIDAVYGYHINNHPMKELEELISVIPASQGKENKPYYSDPSCKYNMWDGEE